MTVRAANATLTLACGDERRRDRSLLIMHISRRTLGAVALAFIASIPASIEARQQADPQARTGDRAVVQRRIPKSGREGALPFVRTELFFGTAKPEGVVTDEEFRRFIDEEVTPRFPDGLTLLKGDGQFRGEDDIVIKEQSFVLILLYPYETFTKSSQNIQQLRELYKDQFDQESVLRVDDPFIVWVSF
jgi:hypothetical protein